MARSARKTGKDPVQARSARRVSRILEAATALILEEGASGFALSAVAKRAETAQGSLYQFFPSREALLERLHREAAEAFEAAAAEARAAFVAAAEKTPEALVDAFLPRLAAVYQAHPAYPEIRRARRRDPGALAIEAAADGAAAEALALSLREAAPGLSEAAAEAAAYAVVEAGDALLSAAEAEEGPAAEALRRETRRLLVAYARAVAAEA